MHGHAVSSLACTSVPATNPQTHGGDPQPTSVVHPQPPAQKPIPCRSWWAASHQMSSNHMLCRTGIGAASGCPYLQGAGVVARAQANSGSASSASPPPAGCPPPSHAVAFWRPETSRADSQATELEEMAVAAAVLWGSPTSISSAAAPPQPSSRRSPHAERPPLGAWPGLLSL